MPLKYMTQLIPADCRLRAAGSWLQDVEDQAMALVISCQSQNGIPVLNLRCASTRYRGNLG